MLSINLKVTRSLIPPIYYRLSAVPEGQFSHSYYGVRHPGGIFSIHLSDVLISFNSLASLVNNLQATGKPCSKEEAEELKSRTQDLLFRLIRYFESGYEVFLCLCDPLQKPTSGQPLYRWLENNGYKNESETYFTNTNTQLAKYRQFFNALKHSSNRLAIFQFVNSQASAKALGFYLEGVDDRGVISPVSSLHPLFQDQHTAWSYNLHLRNFYFLTYHVASEMEAAVQRFCARRGIQPVRPSVPLVLTGLESLISSAFVNTAGRFEKVFAVFYPQEADEEVKSVSFDDAAGSLAFSEYIGGDKAIGEGRGWSAIWSSEGDGFSRSWSMLYRKP
jgi:hypothetical protein